MLCWELGSWTVDERAWVEAGLSGAGLAHSWSGGLLRTRAADQDAVQIVLSSTGLDLPACTTDYPPDRPVTAGDRGERSTPSRSSQHPGPRHRPHWPGTTRRPTKPPPAGPAGASPRPSSCWFSASPFWWRRRSTTGRPRTRRRPPSRPVAAPTNTAPPSAWPPFTASPPFPSPGPQTVTITPATGLVNGQVVHVVGKGFKPRGQYGAMECKAVSAPRPNSTSPAFRSSPPTPPGPSPWTTPAQRPLRRQPSRLRHGHTV